MSRFNKLMKGKNTVVNHGGGKSYNITPEQELYSLVCTMTLSNNYYTSRTDDMERLRSLIKMVDPVYVAKLAVYARKEMYLRSVPLVLTVELAKIHKGNDLISKMVLGVCNRVDEITELLSYYQQSNKRTDTKKLGKLSNQIKKGIRLVFESGRFTEYHFGKYDRKTEVTFKDALFLSHPKSQNKEQEKLFNDLIEGTLVTPYTWETELSKAGQSDSPVTTKKKVWEDLLDSGKVGYMALLRNLRNILSCDVSMEHIEGVCSRLSDKEEVLKSKQFPFRFLSAYRMLCGVSHRRLCYKVQGYIVDKSVKRDMILLALEKAVLTSFENIKGFNDNTLIATDVSASMIFPISERSVITAYDIGSVLSMGIKNVSSISTSGIFGDRWEEMKFPTTNILENSENIYDIEGKVGYSTHGYKVLEWANKQKHTYDNIMMFTDMQMYGGDFQNEWVKYQKRNPNCKLTLFDLKGYGTTPLQINGNVRLIAGWSTSIFDMLDAINKGDSVVDVINDITL